MKWCWSRVPGGIVTWDVYELFRIGERGMQKAMSSGSKPDISDRLEHG